MNCSAINLYGELETLEKYSKDILNLYNLIYENDNNMNVVSVMNDMNDMNNMNNMNDMNNKNNKNNKNYLENLCQQLNTTIENIKYLSDFIINSFDVRAIYSSGALAQYKAIYMRTSVLIYETNDYIKKFDYLSKKKQIHNLIAINKNYKQNIEYFNDIVAKIDDIIMRCELVPKKSIPVISNTVLPTKNKTKISKTFHP